MEALVSAMNFSTNTESALSVIKDPFNVSKIVACRMWMTKDWVSGKMLWTGLVEFQNGNTKGEQQTVKTEEFEGMMAQLKAIIDSVTK